MPIIGVTWSFYNKIQTITKTDGPNFTYTYYPDQKRATQLWNSISTWYVRDAQGNTLAIYDNKGSHINWREQDLYGSSRLGMWTPNMNLTTNNAQTIWDTIGHKQYQLENHLGNVLATITDKRAPHSTNGTTIDYYMPEVTTAQEYFAFGFAIPYRNYTLNQPYRYGFNGKENDNQVKLDWSGNGIPGAQQDYGARIYDPRLGRFLSVDPLQHQYAGLTPYQFASNSPIADIDLDGLEKYYYLFDVNKKNGITSLKTVVQTNEPSGWDAFKNAFHLSIGDPTEEYERLIDFNGDVIKGIKRTYVLITPYGNSVSFDSEKALKKFDYSTYDKKTLDRQAMYVQAGLAASPAELSSGNTFIETTTEEELLTGSELLHGGGNLKDLTPQIGETFKNFGISISNGKIEIADRAVTNGTFDFVIDNNGGLKIGTGHANLSGGAESVQAAGTLSIYKGRVTTITNSSGHYQPTVAQGEAALGLLEKAGVNVQGANVKLYNSSGQLEKSYKVQ